MKERVVQRSLDSPFTFLLVALPCSVGGGLADEVPGHDHAGEELDFRYRSVTVGPRSQIRWP
jgi:hypothetical protein